MNKIEGMPDGWELVRIGVPKDGEWYIGFSGHPEQAQSQYDSVLTIISKTKKPKQYRPFANAAEFAPHRDRWWKKIGNKETFPPCWYDDLYHGGLHFRECFVNRTFDDGTPFGVEVQS